MGSLPLTIGSYRIVRQLGEGGMGVVYEARHEGLDRRVALKCLHPEHAANPDIVARFFNEAKILSKLEHPSIVQVSDFGQSADGIAYLVMELLRGESLARRLRENVNHQTRISLVAALQFAWQVADVLAMAHAQGIVHRDLKPDNLMLVPDPVGPGGERVKLLDFGIAKLLKAADSNVPKTNTLAVMGTPMYMSPEQCAGAGGVDAKTDVYSLGCLLYEVLGGRPPFVAEGAGNLIGMHLFLSPPPLAQLAPQLPAKVVTLVHQLLTKDKANRPAMSRVADEIGAILRETATDSVVTQAPSSRKSDPDATRAIAVPAVVPRIGPQGRMRALLAGAMGLSLLAGFALVRLPQKPTQSVVSKNGSSVRPTPDMSVMTPDSGAIASESSAVLTEPAARVLLAEIDNELQRQNWAAAISKSNHLLSAEQLPSVIHETAKSLRTRATDEGRAQQSYERLLNSAGSHEQALASFQEIPENSFYRVGAHALYEKSFRQYTEKHLAAAERARQDGKCEVFRDEVSVVLALDPTQPTAAQAKMRPCVAMRQASPNAAIPVTKATATASASASEQSLVRARSALENAKYTEAINHAMSGVQANPNRAWRLIGLAACNVKNLQLAKESFQHLDADGKLFLVYACQQHGIENRNGSEFFLKGP